MTSVLEILKIIVGKRWPLIVFLFVVELAVVIAVANSAFFPSEQTSFEKQYNGIQPILNESAAGQVSGIFANNLKVAAAELFPGLGLLIFGVSLYQTARIIEVIGLAKGVGVGLALANLFILPSTWLELPAYAIAAAEGIYILYAFYLGFHSGWQRFLREIRFVIVNLVLIAGVLIVAAVFETVEIQLEQGPIQTQAYALLTWLPFAAVLAGWLTFWRRARRDAPALEARDDSEPSADDGATLDSGY